MMLREKQAEAVKRLEKEQKRYEIEENKKAEREEIGRTVDRYNDFLPTVKEIEKKKAELAADQKHVQKLANDLEDLQ